MRNSIRNIMPAIVIAGLLNWPVTAQELSQNGELVASIEERIEGQVWLRKAATGDGLVSQVQMGSFAANGSLQLFKQLPPVTELDASIDSDEAARLLELPQLRRLRICMRSTDDKVETTLPLLPNLEYLEISPFGTDVGPLMESVSRLSRLRHLTIYGSGADATYGVKDKDLVWLKGVPLETLRTTNVPGVNGLEHITKIKTLRTLIFEHADFQSSHLEALNQLPRLTTLKIGRALDDSGFEALSTFPALRRLVFDFGAELSVDRVKSLSRISTLELIECRFGNNSPDKMEEFRKLLPKVRLVFYGPTKNPLDEFQGATIEPFRIVEERYLYSGPTKFSDETHFHNRLILERAKPVTGALAERVRAILVDPETYNMNGGAGCFVPGLGLRFKKDQKTCDVLVCLLCDQVGLNTPRNHLLDESEWLHSNGGGSISDDARLKLLNVYREILGEPKECGIYMRALPKDSSEIILEELTSFLEIHVETDNPETEKWAPLVSLNFTDFQITETHLKAIAPLRKLQELKLNGTPIGDAELEPLKAYNFLKILDLSGTNVTPSGLEAIRQSLPETKIIYETKQK